MLFAVISTHSFVESFFPSFRYLHQKIDPLVARGNFPRNVKDPISKGSLAAWFLNICPNPGPAVEQATRALCPCHTLQQK